MLWNMAAARITFRQWLIDLWTTFTGRPLGAPRHYDAQAEADKVIDEIVDPPTNNRSSPTNP